MDFLVYSYWQASFMVVEKYEKKIDCCMDNTTRHCTLILDCVFMVEKVDFTVVPGKCS